jgi:hypothetical protein
VEVLSKNVDDGNGLMVLLFYPVCIGCNLGDVWRHVIATIAERPSNTTHQNMLHLIPSGYQCPLVYHIIVC